MAADPIQISQDQLAHCAGEVFYGLTVDEVPAKLWLDHYVAGQQTYVRATFDADLTTRSMERMGQLAATLTKRHGVPLLAVCYRDDHTWEEIEVFSQALNRVV